MYPYYIYEKSTGKTLRHSCSKQVQDFILRDSEEIVWDSIQEDEYTNPVTLQKEQRPTLPFIKNKVNNEIIADGLDVFRVEQLPVGCRIKWPNGQRNILPADWFEFKVDMAGTYTFSLEMFPYLPEEITIAAISPS